VNDRFLIRKRDLRSIELNDGNWPLADAGREKVDGLARVSTSDPFWPLSPGGECPLFDVLTYGHTCWR